jgi:hypothetical protein
MSDLYFSEFEAVTDYDFQKLSQSQSQSDSDGSEYQPSRESEEESSSFSESQVGCYFLWSIVFFSQLVIMGI